MSIFVKKGKDEIRGKCRACGTISKLDDKHKFSTYIKNFPPKYDEEVTKKLNVEGTTSSIAQDDNANKPGIDKATKEKMSI